MTFKDALKAVRAADIKVPKNDCSRKADFVQFLASNPDAALVAAKACPDIGRIVAQRVKSRAAGERILRFADAVYPDIQTVILHMPAPHCWVEILPGLKVPEWSLLTRKELLDGLAVLHDKSEADVFLTETREILSNISDDIVWDFIWYLYSHSSPNNLCLRRGVSEKCQDEINSRLGTWYDNVRSNANNDIIFAEREIRRLKL